MKKPITIDARPVRSEVLSPRDYLRLRNDDPRRIERAEFIPPSPGKAGFGAFQVRYTRPIFRRLVCG